MNPLPEFLIHPNPQIYKTGNYIVYDSETTTHNYGSALEGCNRLVLSCWLRVDRNKDRIYRREIRGGEFEQNELLADVAGVDYCIGHNIKFDLQWLKRAGLDLSSILVYDTQVAEKVILGNRQGRLSLDAVALRYGLGAKDNLGKALVHSGEVPTEDVPEEVLAKYCWQDVDLCHAVFQAQMRVFAECPWLLPVVYTHCLLTPVLADIEFNGLKLDSELVELEYDRLQQRCGELEGQLHKLTGGINLNSPKQVGEFLYNQLGFKEPVDYKGNIKKTATGKPLTDSDTISSLKVTTKVQESFLSAYTEYNKNNDALSKAISKFQACCKDGNGILHAQFNQTVTQTHRLSSSGLAPYKVQFQNLYREYKKLFHAKLPNWLMGEADGANLEFRVAGFLGQDKVIYQDIVNQVDVHAFTSNVLTQSGQPTGRQDAKEHTFKPLYGGQTGTKAEKAYYAAFRQRYNQAYKVQQGWVDSVLASGAKSLRTLWGMVFYWPTTKVTRSGYIENTSSIFNYPIQSLATAEIIPIAVVFFWHMIKQAGCKMQLVNTVHDSIVVEMPPEEQNVFKEFVTDALTTRVYQYMKDVYDISFNFPLGCGIKIGSHWGKGQEEKVNAVMPPFDFKQQQQQQ